MRVGRPALTVVFPRAARPSPRKRGHGHGARWAAAREPFGCGSTTFFLPPRRLLRVRRSRIPVRGTAEIARALAFVFDASKDPPVRLWGYVRPGQTTVVTLE